MDLGAMQSHIDVLSAELAKMHAGHSAMVRRLSELTVTVTSADHLVRCTVDARGHVQTLSLDPRIYQHRNANQLGTIVTATIQQATAEATEQAMTIAREYVADDLLSAHLDVDFDAVLAHRDRTAGE
jgi:DNA-binding protein YbaB